MIEFIIPMRAVSWNIFYGGKHWSVRSKLKNDWFILTRQYMRRTPYYKEMITTVRVPLKITIESYAKQPIDADNCASGKFIIDTIKKELGIDDDPKTIPEVTFRSNRSIKEYIIVKIESYDNRENQKPGGDFQV